MSNQIKNEINPYLFFEHRFTAQCNWCHVMEHESFENEKTAEILNQYFVSIKADREESSDGTIAIRNIIELLMKLAQVF